MDTEDIEENYAGNLEVLAGSKFCPRPQLQWLSRCLNRPGAHILKPDGCTSPACDEFVRVLDLSDGEQPRKISPLDFKQLHVPPDIVFLHGQPCPRWLRLIGARCDVDTEFFSQHMEQTLRGAPDPRLVFRQLPSTQQFLRLRITTTGSGRPAKSLSANASQDEVETFRTRVVKKFKECAELLRDPVTMTVGGSIIRDFFVHDECNYSFDQYISVCVKQDVSSPTVLVWLDMGGPVSSGTYQDLFQELSRLSSWTPKFHVAAHIPIIWQTTAGSKDFHELIVRKTQGSNEVVKELCYHYGDLVDHRMAKKDSLYAVSPLLRLAHGTELSFLSLLEARLERELEPAALNERDVDLGSLLHTKNSLTRRIHELESNVRFLQQFRKSKTPTVSDDATMRDMHEDLSSQFRDLLDLAKGLIGRCNESISFIQAVTAVKLSERAMEENRSLRSLTKLAFFFVPMTFATSLFGMNVKEFSDENKTSISIFFAIALPLTVIAVIPLIPGARTWFRWPLTRFHSATASQIVKEDV